MSSKFVVKQSNALSLSPALPLIVKGWSSILEGELGDLNNAEGMVHNDHQVIWVENSSTPVAALTFTEHADTNLIWIRIAFVDPKFRKAGLYTKMYNKLRKYARSKNYKKIQSGINDSNKTMQAVAKKMGRKIEYSVWTDWL